MNLPMKTNILMAIIALMTLSGAAVWAFSNKTLADHTHSDLTGYPKGIFDMGHSGGLDRNGGHYDNRTGTYHFHR